MTKRNPRSFLQVDIIIIIIVVTAVILVCLKAFVVKCTAGLCQVIKKTNLISRKIALYLIRNAFRRKISRFHEFSLENYMHFLFLKKKLIICISFKSKRQLSLTEKKGNTYCCIFLSIQT